MPYRKYISVIFSPGGGDQSFALQLRKWHLWTILTATLMGWIFLFLGIIGMIIATGYARNWRALAAENNRLRIAMAKADSLAQELEEIRAMRVLMESSLLVAQKKSHTKVDAAQWIPDWLPKSPVFSSQRGLPELTEYLKQMDRIQAYIPAEMPAKGIITAKFGESGGLFKRPHTGVDIMLNIGMPIYSTADGIVAKTNEDDELGKFIEINHLNNYRTLYAHLSNFAVSRGDPVQKGELIGHSGESGKAYNPHLHYEVRYDGKPIDPLSVQTAEQDGNRSLATQSTVEKTSGESDSDSTQ